MQINSRMRVTVPARACPALLAERPIMAPTPRYPERSRQPKTLKNMRYAFAYGADAVYAGQPRAPAGAQ